MGSGRPAIGWIALLVSMVACAAGLGAWLCLDPDATNRLRDDAFYEFAWAANVATGNGPTVSDGVTTSGVQLLWSLLLVPCVWCCGVAALPLVAPWLGFLLHVATAALWWRRTADRITRWCIAACWLGHPLLLRESQNGQETALACLLVSGLWLYRAASERVFFTWSLLAVLARTDLFAFVILLAIWRHRRHLRWAWPTPAVVLASHVAANVALGGGIWPDSAWPMAWLWHANHALAHPDGSGFWSQSWWYLRPVLLGGPWAMASAMGVGFCVFVLVRPWWPPSMRALPALAVGCACALGAHDLATPAWVALLLALVPAATQRAMPWQLLPLLLGFFAIVMLHWGLRWYPRDYYLAPGVVVGIAAIGRYGRCRPLLLTFALAQLLDHQRVRPEPLAGQIEMAMAGRFLREVLPAGERVGCFNSGLVTFHSAVVANGPDRRAVVNLDGVVDARSFAALRRAELGSWLDDQGMRFVLDNQTQFALDPRQPHAVGSWFGAGFDPAVDLVEVARFDAPGIDNGRPGGDSMRLYWRRGRGEPPPTPAARDLGRGDDGARYVLWPAQPGQVLEQEAADGTRQRLLVADAATAFVLRLDLLPTGSRLFVAGATEPVLHLPPL